MADPFSNDAAWRDRLAAKGVIATIERIRREDSDFITPDTIRAYTGCTIEEARAGIVAVFGQDWLDRQDAVRP